MFDGLWNVFHRILSGDFSVLWWIIIAWLLFWQMVAMITAVNRMGKMR